MAEDKQIGFLNKKKYSKSFVINSDEKADFITNIFGLKNDYENKIFEIEEPDFKNILYITGESGSGKSVLLNEIYTETKVEIKDKPLYELVDGRFEESAMLLSKVGLSDATIYSLKYSQLSDSQKRRVEFLYMFLENDFIVIDEFLSTLDRKTAKSVSYMVGQLIRKANKKLVVATAHSDLKDFLMPDLIIDFKSFPSRFKQYTISEKNNPFDNVIYEYANKEIYRDLPLGDLHYKGKYTGGTKEYLLAKFEDEIIGVLVSTNRIGKKGRKISRVIVHPSYRGCGIGKGLVRKYIDDFKYTESIATMGKFNPFFEKGGMVRVNDSIVKSPKGLEQNLKLSGFDIEKWADRNYCNEMAKHESIRKITAEYSKSANKLIQPGGKKLTDEEIKQYILTEQNTAARVLHQLRRKEYAKYKTKELIEFEGVNNG